MQQKGLLQLHHGPEILQQESPLATVMPSLEVGPNSKLFGDYHEGKILTFFEFYEVNQLYENQKAEIENECLGWKRILQTVDKHLSQVRSTNSPFFLPSERSSHTVSDKRRGSS